MQKKKASLATTASWAVTLSFVLGIGWVVLNCICSQCASWDRVVYIPVKAHGDHYHYWYCRRCQRIWSDHEDPANYAVVVPSE